MKEQIKADIHNQEIKQIQRKIHVLTVDIEIELFEQIVYKKRIKRTKVKALLEGGKRSGWYSFYL